jgi:hypothetical protein
MPGQFRVKKLWLAKCTCLNVINFRATIYQIACKIKPLYLTHYDFYLTSNTTRVV